MKQLLRFSFLLLALLLPATATAYDFEVDGIYYSINGNNATVTNYNCNTYSGDVVIPDTVTYNGKTYVVTKIGQSAFSGCSGLTSITIPNSVVTIDNRAFEDCSGLTTATIGESVTYVGYEAFRGCTSLDVLYFNAVSCADFDDSDDTWYDPFCSLNVSKLYIGDSVQRIPAYLANNWDNLRRVNISSSVTSIGDGAFLESGLIRITIPKSITSIGSFAFAYCYDLDDVYCLISDPSLIQLGYSVFKVYNNGSSSTQATLHVPFGSASAYRADNKWGAWFETIVEMDPILATSVELDKVSAELTIDETVQLTAAVMPEDASNRTVTWASSDEAVATVDENGLVTAVAPGSAIITATTNDSSNLSASCNVTVLQGIVQAESIKLNVTTAGLNEGATLQLTATVLPEGASSESVIWASNNPSVATVDSNGLVTTHSVGTATITAITTDGSNLSASCTVTLLPVGVKGDVNGDSNISISDVSALIDYLLSGTWN